MDNNIDDKINNAIAGQFVKYLKEESGKSSFQKASEDLWFAYKSFLNVGFNEDQSMELTAALFQHVLDTIADDEEDF